MMEDKSILSQDPFRSVGSITVLFKDKMSDARAIMETIDKINIRMG